MEDDVRQFSMKSMLTNITRQQFEQLKEIWKARRKCTMIAGSSVELNHKCMYWR